VKKIFFGLLLCLGTQAFGMNRVTAPVRRVALSSMVKARCYSSQGFLTEDDGYRAPNRIYAASDYEYMALNRMQSVRNDMENLHRRLAELPQDAHPDHVAYELHNIEKDLIDSSKILDEALSHVRNYQSKREHERVSAAHDSKMRKFEATIPLMEDLSKKN